MTQPAIRDVRFVDPLLTNLTLGFRNTDYYWSRIAPVVAVDQKSGRYPVYSSDFWFRLTEGMDRAEGGRYPRGGWGTTSGSYECFEIGVEIPRDDSVTAASQLPESLDITDAAWLANQIELKLERKVSDALFKTGVWGTDISGATASSSTAFVYWNDFANSDPIKDIRTAKERVHLVTGAEPLNAFTSHKVMEALVDHPLLTSIYRRNSDGPLTPADVNNALGITIDVARSVHDTGLEGANDNDDLSRTASFANREFIWGDHLLLQVQNTPQLGVANGAYTYIWNEANNVPWAAQQYRNDEIRGDIRRVFTWPQPLVLSPHHGYFFNNCLTS